MDYFLLFTQQFDRDKGLDWGRLSINNLRTGTSHIWRATSSYVNQQYPESFHERGGMLPPQYRVKDLSFYTVSTKPIPMSHVKGVAGNFYQILPFEVVTDKGGKRSDFGIHKDANAPGSLGCIVTTDDRFAEFEDVMKWRNQKGDDSLPLFVQYS